MFKKNKNKINAPWLKNYYGLPESIDYPDTSIYSVLEETALKYPNYNAYSYFNGTSTFSNLITNIKKCAKSLRSFGIGKGDVVTICMANTPEAVISFYAVNMIGAVANMIHPLSAETEIKHYLEVSNSKMLITIDITWEKIEQIIDETKVEHTIVASVRDSMPVVLGFAYEFTNGRKIKKPAPSNRVCYWKEFIKIGAEYRGEIDAKTKGEDVAAIFYSGGTTGDPKGIILSNLNCNSVAMGCREEVKELEAGDRLLDILPMFHGFGLIVCVHTVLIIGATVILIPKFSPKSYLKLVLKEKPDAIVAVPTLFESMIKTENIEKVDLSFLKLIISGGDSLSASLKNKVDKFLIDHNANVEVREGYGLSECASASCLSPKGGSREGSIGLPLPDVFYKIVVPITHIEVPYGEEGEICISGPSVMIGYLNDPAETGRALQVHEDGRVWLHTGDVGSMDEDGYVYFKYRRKRMIVSNGFNVYPSYIENVIDSHPKVSMSTVIGIEHKYKKQVPKAFIVLKPGVKPTKQLKKEILDLCAKNLSEYSIPTEIEYRSDLPKTTIGKVAFGKLEEEEKNKSHDKEVEIDIDEDDDEIEKNN